MNTFKKLKSSLSSLLPCFLIFLYLFIALPSYSQAPNNQDCAGAIVICQNTFSQPNAFTGQGNVLNEINPASSCLATGERNDVWYTFTVQTSGLLNFSITANNFGDDYDWAVFNLSNATCADIATNPALEVSCNFNSSTAGGITGPNGQSGNQNEPPIPVQAGETYVVNVSNFLTNQAGYVLDFIASSAQIFDNIVPALQTITTPIVCNTNTFTFNFSENVQCGDVDASKFSLTGPGGPYTITSVSGAACASGSQYEKTYTVNFNPGIASGGNFNFNLTGTVRDLCNNAAAFTSIPFTITSLQLDVSSLPDTCERSVGVAIVTPPGDGANYSYSWSSFTGTDSSLTGLIKGSYTVTVSTPGLCPQSISVLVDDLLPPVASFSAFPKMIPQDHAICSFTDGSFNATSWHWNFGDSTYSDMQNPQHGYTEPGNYLVILEVTSDAGCTSIDTMTVYVVFATNYVPNSFTPNGDDLNDYFGMMGENMLNEDYEMVIFNRWGMEVYRTRKTNYLWDGFSKSNNSPAESGVYIYKINYKDLNGKSHQKVGEVTLLR